MRLIYHLTVDSGLSGIWLRGLVEEQLIRDVIQWVSIHWDRMEDEILGGMEEMERDVMGAR